MSLHHQEDDAHTTDHPATWAHDVEQPNQADHQGRLDQQPYILHQPHCRVDAAGG